MKKIIDILKTLTDYNICKWIAEDCLNETLDETGLVIVGECSESPKNKHILIIRVFDLFGIQKNYRCASPTYIHHERYLNQIKEELYHPYIREAIKSCLLLSLKDKYIKIPEECSYEETLKLTIEEIKNWKSLPEYRNILIENTLSWLELDLERRKHYGFKVEDNLIN